jgi:hypothetical protein
VLLALVFVVPLSTRDHNGFRRARTAWTVWSTVPPRLPSLPDARATRLAFDAAAAVTVAGVIVLLWLTPLRLGRRRTVRAVGVGPSPRLPVLSAVRELRDMLGTASVSALSTRSVRWILYAVAAYVAWRLGAVPLLAPGDGGTFASMDHPFHLARAETLRRSLAAGEPLRWIAHHQGGYPAEFYPFGFAMFEVFVWSVFLGTVSIASAHTLAVIATFLAPMLVFWGMARRDGWPAVVALAACVAHVAVPGDIWQGGYSELVQMGLVGNVSAAVAVFAAFLWLCDGLGTGARRPLGLAAAAAGASLWLNPRSGLGLVACAAGAWIVVARHSWSRRSLWPSVWPLAAVAGTAALLAMPELLSLARFGDLYYFVRFTAYADSLDYLAASADAVSAPVFALAVAGGIAAFLLPRDKQVTRATVVALLCYAAITIVFSFSGSASSVIQQLETTRLMPLQRLLTIYLAAVGLHVVARAIAASGLSPAWNGDTLQAGAVALLAIVYLGPVPLMPSTSRGLYPTDRSGTPGMVDFERRLKVAETQAPPGTAILVVGSALSAHQQLWAPLIVDAPLFYDNWMWAWHTHHPGPYDPRSAAWYRPKDIGRIFEQAALDHDGIGVVLVTTPAAQLAARRSPALELLLEGEYAVYRVVHATPIVTFGDARADTVRIRNHVIDATTLHADGDALIRRNWYPRWKAEVNGHPAHIARREDGYMTVAVPPGPVTLRLVYGTDAADWAARAASGLGLMLLLALLWPAGRV